MSQYQKQKLWYFLSQVKDTIRIDGDKNYKLVTISNTGIIKKRKTELGINIKAAVLNKVHKGDFIYSRLAAHTGSFGIIPEELDLATASNEMPCFKIDKTKILPEYLDFILKQKSFINKLKLLTQGMGRVRIKEKQFLDVEIEYHPNITTQHIFLKKFMSIHKYERILTEESIYQSTYITKLRQSILQEAIEGKLTADWRKENPVRKGDPDYDTEALLEKIQEEKQIMFTKGLIKQEKPLLPIDQKEIPFILPIGWVWSRIGVILKNPPRNGYSPKEVNYETKVKSLKLGATTWGVFNPLERKFIDEDIPADSVFWLKPNDILIQRSNSIDYVGVTAIYTGKENEFIYPDLMMKLEIIKPISVLYSHKVLSAPFCREYFRKNAKGAQKSMPKINQGVVNNTIIPIPPLAEQQAIVDRVEKLLSIVDELEKQVFERKEQSEQLMQAVLREAFEGVK